MARRLFDEIEARIEYRLSSLRKCFYKQPFGWKCGGRNNSNKEQVQVGGLLSFDRLYCCRVPSLLHVKLESGKDKSLGASASASAFALRLHGDGVLYAYARDGGVNADMHNTVHVIQDMA